MDTIVAIVAGFFCLFLLCSNTKSWAGRAVMIALIVVPLSAYLAIRLIIWRTVWLKYTYLVVAVVAVLDLALVAAVIFWPRHSSRKGWPESPGCFFIVAATWLGIQVFWLAFSLLAGW